ncbi:ETS translocation variant 1-like isoform X2 [Orbicella faveolata]|uniref:ETS translocation variant 1-like isoform X2 n=1 Tax=Orbicella faveolata TaxID=48498 RepID=UPI0009E65C7B|nr:ETS translocation variant 1-like isoform X2 [Orbicella faveolata]
MANMVGSTPLLDQLEVFQYLRTFQLNHLTQMNQWNILHANQPSVPEATPAPGFERLVPTQRADQLVPSSTAQVDGVPHMSYMEHLTNEEDEFDNIFNGAPNLPDYAVFNFDLENDIDQPPDLSVFDKFQDQDEVANEVPREQYPLTVIPTVLPVQMKIEARSPSCCNSECSYPSASPPHSPSISEAGSNAYSTDEGIVEDMSDLSDLEEILSNLGSPHSVHEDAEKQPQADVKEEPAVPVTPPKGRRKRGPKPPVKYRGDGPIQLWQFLLELLINVECTNLIKWTQEEDYEFKILQPATVAKMWGKKKNKPTMNYEKLSRGLRYYYGKNVIEKVHGKRYVYQFMCNIPKILGYDPMVNKCEDFVEDSVCGEPVMSPEVEGLLVSSSVEEGKLAGSLDFSLLF